MSKSMTKAGVSASVTTRLGGVSVSSAASTMTRIVRMNETRSLDRYQHDYQRCFSSFSFAGPKTLDEILQKEKMKDLQSSEIADLWMSYHEQKDSIHGIVRNGEEGLKCLSRAKESPFFVQPVIKDKQGFYVLVSQFMEPCHFILAYLEDYRLDPAAANPLMSLSVFTDYSSDRDLTLVRVDVTNKGLEDQEGYKVASLLIDSYAHDDEYNQLVLPFNAQPDKFDFEGFISRQQDKWKTLSGDTAETDQ